LLNVGYYYCLQLHGKPHKADSSAADMWTWLGRVPRHPFDGVAVADAGAVKWRGDCSLP
jgi:hypothetical protein